jgi:hypothetical protein
MENNWIGRRTPTSLVWPAALLGAVGLWFWLAHRGSVAVLPGAAALVLTAILGIVWLSRARAARRFNAAVDAYAEREIDRGRRTRAAAVLPARRRPVPTKGEER